MMSKFFSILSELTNKNIHHCFNCQGNNKMFYNLSVVDPKGNVQYLHSNNMGDMEKGLLMLWGHLIETKPSNLPLPPNFPMPR